MKNIFSQDNKNEKYVDRNYINKIFLTQQTVFYFFKLLDNSCSCQFPCIHWDKNIEGVIKQEISKWQSSNQKMQSIYIHIIEYRFKKFWSDTMVYPEGFRSPNICLGAKLCAEFSENHFWKKTSLLQISNAEILIAIISKLKFNYLSFYKKVHYINFWVFFSFPIYFNDIKRQNLFTSFHEFLS